VKEPNMFHNYETEKITCKASDAAENLQLYRVVRFLLSRLFCMTTHLMLFSERLRIYASCMPILGGRTEQLLYRKTSNTSPRLLLEQMSQTLVFSCIGDPACIRDPASIKTLLTCHIKLLCV